MEVEELRKPSFSAVVRSSQQETRAPDRAIDKVWVRIVTEVKLKGRSENNRLY